MHRLESGLAGGQHDIHTNHPSGHLRYRIHPSIHIATIRIGIAAVINSYTAHRISPYHRPTIDTGHIYISIQQKEEEQRKKALLDIEKRQTEPYISSTGFQEGRTHARCRNNGSFSFDKALCNTSVSSLIYRQESDQSSIARNPTDPQHLANSPQKTPTPGSSN